jgi:hypothetical protein
MAASGGRLVNFLSLRSHRTKRQRIGTVEAPDEATAIKIAIVEFKVPEAHQSRLIAQPVE